MKKFFALVLAMALICCFTTAALADSDVVSPENGNTDVDSNETSPQTGYDFGIESVVLLAVLCGGAALYIGKKVKA